jgi:DNA-binding NtrC family response regulator
MRGFSMEQAEVRSLGSRPTLKDLVEGYERHVIEDALRAAHGNQRRAARALGVLPTTLHEKMKRLGLLHRVEPRPSESPEAIALAG